MAGKRSVLETLQFYHDKEEVGDWHKNVSCITNETIPFRSEREITTILLAQAIPGLFSNDIINSIGWTRKILQRERRVNKAGPTLRPMVNNYYNMY